MRSFIPQSEHTSQSGIDNPSVSISGLIGESFSDLPEDVDFFSFDLEAGQTVGLDIDTEEILPNTINFRQVVYPALADILQTPDTELRLFDAEGNELATNRDGAAPGEAFSRDPYLEFTAETAGTYYVGVSQLGNRSYDPFVSRSGSGWTFPEVGINNGFYELTATLESASAFGDLVVFGDSLSDIGNVFELSGRLLPPSPPFAEGRFSNGDVVVDFIAEALNLPESESYLLGGSNYAFGGAKTGEGTSFIGGLEGIFEPVEVPNIAQQIDLYLADRTPLSTDLFYIYGGGNDFIDSLEQEAVVPAAESVVDNIAAHITELAEAGAENFVVPNLASLGIIPLFADQPPEAQALINGATAEFNQLLDVELDELASALEVTIIEPDYNNIVEDIVTNPEEFGLTNSTDSTIDFSNGMLRGNPDDFFFWDLIHPTTVVNDIIADEAIALLLGSDAPNPIAPNPINQIGTDAAETLTGGDRIDGIDGQGGDDTIAGGLGDDLILGGDGDDVLRGDLNDRSPQDNVAGGNDIIFGGDGNDRIGGKAGNDILSGDAGDDVIWGDDGDDILMGVIGNDTLVGDNGSDGSGSDLFVFGNGDGTDTIVDFEVGTDRIGLVEGELTFTDLTLAQDGVNTLLGVAESSEVLAILNNVQASALTENSFEIVPDVSNPEEALAIV